MPTLCIEIDLDHPQFAGSTEDAGYVLANVLCKFAGLVAVEGLPIDCELVERDVNGRTYLIAGRTNTPAWRSEHDPFGGELKRRIAA